MSANQAYAIVPIAYPDLWAGKAKLCGVTLTVVEHGEVPRVRVSGSRTAVRAFGDEIGFAPSDDEYKIEDLDPEATEAQGGH